jgi:hypothetical protein
VKWPSNTLQYDGGYERNVQKEVKEY